MQEDDLIKLIENQGVKIASYYIGESPATDGGGNATLYSYNGKNYEIVQWNKNAKEYKPYSKTIAIENMPNIKQEGGDLANPDKSRIFASTNITKDEISEIIAGTRQVTGGTAIQAALSYLRGSEGASSLDRSPYSFPRSEEERLREYISKNNLWVPSPDESNKIGKGGEAVVYLYGDYVLKINDAPFYGSWEDYFNSLLLHNYFFYGTPYELVGFSEHRDYDNNILYAVVKQPFIQATSITDLNKVRKFMSELGFVSTGLTHYHHPELGIDLKDLHEGNVLTKDDTLYFVDTLFYIKDKSLLDPKQMREGGKIPERYKDMGFSYVGQKKKSTRPEKKWMVLAKKGDKYKVVHGGQKGMEDFSQHRDKERQRRFWDRMGGFDSEKTKDPFSPLYWHKRFGTWEAGGLLDNDESYLSSQPNFEREANDRINRLRFLISKSEGEEKDYYMRELTSLSEQLDNPQSK